MQPFRQCQRMSRCSKQVGSAVVPWSCYSTVMTACAHCKNAALVAIACASSAHTRFSHSLHTRHAHPADRLSGGPPPRPPSRPRAYRISMADDGAEEHVRRERDGRVRVRRVQQRHRQRDLRHLGLRLPCDSGLSHQSRLHNSTSWVLRHSLRCARSRHIRVAMHWPHVMRHPALAPLPQACESRRQAGHTRCFCICLL